MTEKLHAFVCDRCNVCVGKSVDGYPINNGWKTIYHDHLANEPIEHYCPKCEVPGEVKDG